MDLKKSWFSLLALDNAAKPGKYFNWDRDRKALLKEEKAFIHLDLLKTRVGVPGVISNPAQDLQVALMTIAKWINPLERMYVIFMERPYTYSISRAIQKPPKIFFSTMQTSKEMKTRVLRI